MYKDKNNSKYFEIAADINPRTSFHFVSVILFIQA